MAPYITIDFICLKNTPGNIAHIC